MLYRPPSGSKVEALVELENLWQKLPSKRVFVTGDFNADLFIPGSQKFESTIFSNNMIPLISLATQFKPGCNPSLLDNVLTNSLENIKVAGVFESGVSHHHPIFCFFEDVVPKIEIVTTTKPKYDNYESNLGGFELDMRELAITGNEYSASSFNIFVNAIKIKIDNNFRTESDSTKKSTRTRLANPRITQGIIASVSKSIIYMHNGAKVSLKEINVAALSFMISTKCIVKKLKGMIKHAKRVYYNKRFDSAKGNMKKTWALINELRIKSKCNIKSCFKIDGELVVNKREIARNMNTKLCSSQPVSQLINPNRSFADYLGNRVCSSMFL